MALIDDIIKWLKTPKTIKGIVGIIAIIIILAADFAYWAGQDFVTAESTGPSEDGEMGVGEWEYVLDVDESKQDSLMFPSGGIIIIVGTNVKSYPFEVQENAHVGFVNVTVSGTHARPDLDLRVYGPDGDIVGESATEQADEFVELERKDFNRTGPGTYEAEVENYSTFMVDYTITIQIWNNVTVDENEEVP